MRWLKSQLEEICASARTRGKVVVAPECPQPREAAESLRFALYRYMREERVEGLKISLVGGIVVVWKPETPVLNIIVEPEEAPKETQDES